MITVWAVVSISLLVDYKLTENRAGSTSFSFTIVFPASRIVLGTW